MPQLKYGDCVVLVQKSRDPQTKEVSVQRTNAFVMRSVVQPEGAEKFSPAKVQSTQALKGPNTQPLPGGEYLDLMYPRPLPNGQTSTTVQMPELIFGRAHAVAPWKEGAFIGWEIPKVAEPAAVGEQAKLKEFLLENYKKETGDETPEACAIRLLTKKKA
jgi:hypothetical protein